MVCSLGTSANRFITVTNKKTDPFFLRNTTNKKCKKKKQLSKSTHILLLKVALGRVYWSIFYMFYIKWEFLDVPHLFFSEPHEKLKYRHFFVVSSIFFFSFFRIVIFLLFFPATMVAAAATAAATIVAASEGNSHCRCSDGCSNTGDYCCRYCRCNSGGSDDNHSIKCYEMKGSRGVFYLKKLMTNLLLFIL